jgi:hypothetical protein
MSRREHVTNAAETSVQVITFALTAGGVVVEATEFGDVLATSGLKVAQGIEVRLAYLPNILLRFITVCRRRTRTAPHT